MPLNWFVVYTKPSQEIAAAIEITQKLDFPVFYPLHRRKRIHNHRVEEVIGPLFPRYIFAQFDRFNSHWGPLKSTRGVASILTDTERRPAPIRDEVIEALRMTPQEPAKEGKLAPLYTPSQRVKVIEGPLQGLEGLFKGNAAQRTRALLDIMGRKVEVPMQSIAAA